MSFLAEHIGESINHGVRCSTLVQCYVICVRAAAGLAQCCLLRPCHGNLCRGDQDHSDSVAGGAAVVACMAYCSLRWTVAHAHDICCWRCCIFRVDTEASVAGVPLFGRLGSLPRKPHGGDWNHVGSVVGVVALMADVALYQHRCSAPRTVETSGSSHLGSVASVALVATSTRACAGARCTHTSASASST